MLGCASRESSLRGIIFTALIFSLAFGLHIVFALKEWTILFRLIAIDLFLLTTAFAQLSLIFGGPTDMDIARKTLNFGTILSIPLTMAYFWAVNEMYWDNWILLTIFIPLLFYYPSLNRLPQLSGLIYDNSSIQITFEEC